VRAAARTPEAVLAALREGAFYASTGPELHDVVVDGRTFEVRSTPAQAIRLVCGPERGSAISSWRLGYNHLGEVLERDGGGLIVHARLVAPRSAPYARVEVHDGRGGAAWANPVFF
jgi:hypothetical protein